jgi:hypothetical protein
MRRPAPDGPFTGYPVDRRIVRTAVDTAALAESAP